ncbi:MAG: dihydrofolate reductase family protein [Bacteroidia bacterium]
MRKVILYIATSLDGKIARLDGNLDWLEQFPNPDKNDYGYQALLNEVDTVLMGYKTYKYVLDMGIENPYPDKQNYVFTRNASHQDTSYLQYIREDIPAFVQKLKQQAGKAIWLVGGGEINTILLNAKLIDEIRIAQVPIILGEGIPLWAKVPNETVFEVQQVEQFPSGIVTTHLFLKS